MDRDQELDEIEKELAQPFLHEPDKLDLAEGDVCWLNMDRICKPDCMAYNPEDTDADGNKIQGPNRCVILHCLGQQGAGALSLIGVSRLLHRRERREGRPAMPEPPKVL